MLMIGGMFVCRMVKVLMVSRFVFLYFYGVGSRVGVVFRLRLVVSRVFVMVRYIEVCGVIVVFVVRDY